MAVFLSPTVLTREVDLSTIPGGGGALRPAFIGTARKGPVNEPVLITSAQQFIDTFGEPYPTSYLGYAVMAYLTEGESCYVLRVGVEYQEGMDPDLAAIAIDTSGAKHQGWGRIPVFTGIDRGYITFREVDSDSPVVFHAAGVASQSFVTVNVEGTGTGSEETLAELVFSSEAYTGCVDETFTLLVTGVDSSGLSYQITDSSGNTVASGTVSESSPGVYESISLTGYGLTFSIHSNIDLGEGDMFTFAVQPDNRSFTVTVEGVSYGPYTVAAGTYSSASDLVDALNTAIGASATFSAVVRSSGLPALQTSNDGRWIQITDTCAFCAELGISRYTYDIPRSYLIGERAGPYAISSANNRVVLDVIGSDSTVSFDFYLSTASGVTADAIVTQLNANSTYAGTQYFEAVSLTVPNYETERVVMMTTLDRMSDQLRLNATFTYLACLRFAEEIGISYPYTSSHRAFYDARAWLPEASSASPGTPRSCDMTDPDYDANQCITDTAYYEHIVGWFVAKYPGTWVNDLRVSLERYTEGVGDVAGRYKITIEGTDGVVHDVIEDVSFDPDDDRYIGDIINPGERLAGENGNAYITWEMRPDAVNAASGEVRHPSPFTDRAFIGGQDGIPTGTLTTALEDAIIGNAGRATGLFALQNPESYDFNLLVIPGISSGSVIASAIQFCENRGDALYIIDPPFGLRPQQVIDWHNGMLTSDLTTALNTSYGALYWSWLKVSDVYNGGTIWIPPSGHVAAVFAKTARETEMWYAPAGLNRGRLPVLDIEYNPTQGERDALYGSGNAVNPIVKFTQDGIVVWGQRTLQRADSALDRVNVRMLLIKLKTDLGRMLRQFIFEQNDRYTRARVVSIINPYLGDIAARRGLTAYAVVCDETNNTPERIDRNELWVSVFVKPTRAAEFIMLNLVVLRTGANFGAQEVLAAGGVVTAIS